MGRKTINYKQGLFSYETLTVQFGGPLSPPQNIFTCTAIKIPDYTYTNRERESLGNGWYGSMETVARTANRHFVIIRDGICIGQMFDPYIDNQRIKTSLIECNEKALQFLKQQGIEYKFLGTYF